MCSTPLIMVALALAAQSYEQLPSAGSEVERIGEQTVSDTDSLLRAGRFWTGGAFSWTSRSGNNTQSLFRLLDESERLSWSIDAPVGYQLYDFFAVGVELGYASDRRTEISTTDGVRTELERFSYDLSVGPFARATLPISAFGLFYLYVDVIARIGIGEEIQDIRSGDQREKELSDVYSISAGVEPGLLALFPSGFAATAGIQLIGARAEWRNSVLNRQVESDSTRADLDFNINLLTLRLAVLYHF